MIMVKKDFGFFWLLLISSSAPKMTMEFLVKAEKLEKTLKCFLSRTYWNFLFSLERCEQKPDKEWNTTEKRRLDFKLWLSSVVVSGFILKHFADIKSLFQEIFEERSTEVSSLLHSGAIKSYSSNTDNLAIKVRETVLFRERSKRALRKRQWCLSAILKFDPCVRMKIFLQDRLLLLLYIKTCIWLVNIC